MNGNLGLKMVKLLIVSSTVFLHFANAPNPRLLSPRDERITGYHDLFS